MATAKELSQTLRDIRRDDEICSFAKNLAAEIGGAPGSGDRASVSPSAERLTFKQLGSKIATQLLGQDGTKALAPSGAAVVGQEFEDDPVALGEVATGLFDVLPVKVHSSPKFSYMLQSTRTNGAAVVATGDVTPTSVFGLTRVENSLAVIAHLSEGIPRYWLLDQESLQEFVDNELQFGLGPAGEAKVIADFNATGGIRAHAFSTSALQTIRKGLTKLGRADLSPAPSCSTRWTSRASSSPSRRSTRLSTYRCPTTLRSGDSSGCRSRRQSPRRRKPRTSSRRMPSCSTPITQGVGVQWSENSNFDDFSKSLIRARCEGRLPPSVKSLLGVVVADLNA